MHLSLSRLFVLPLAAFALAALSQSAAAQTDPGRCNALNPVKQGGTGGDLIVDGPCPVGAGTYTYKLVNVIGPKGSLNFASEGDIKFHAAGILIEADAALIAGTEADPIGKKAGSKLEIHLYGKRLDPGDGIGIDCITGTDQDKNKGRKLGPCGIPLPVWCSQPDSADDMHDDTSMCPTPRPTTHSKVPMPSTLPGPKQEDWFYRYHPLPYDGEDNPRTKKAGYFGYKVLGVSYGGQLQMFGANGSTFDGTDPDVIAKSGTGTSWRRLAATARGGTKIYVAKIPDPKNLAGPKIGVNWKAGDEIVITTTDYVPGHSEVRKIAVNGIVDRSDDTEITLTQALDYTHNGSMFDTGIDATIKARLGLESTTMDNRAAVALLTRSIRIVSDGEMPGVPLPDNKPFPAPTVEDSFFGGHTVVRQGVEKLQLQGVEFVNLGQGGRIAHYPVHFHLARKVPKDTFLKDTSVNESMTRWYVLHGTHNVTLARNVGWKSIGHGYYLEEGTEIDNNLISNIGIYARAALEYPQYSDNPRRVPGILAHARIGVYENPNAPQDENVPFYSDWDHPSVFWFMNAWNRFENNMAVGASGCGVCYWMLPGAVSGHSISQQWEGYAVLQMGQQATKTVPGNATSRAGLTPVKSFVGNTCSTAAMSFSTTANGAACVGVGKFLDPNKANWAHIPAVPNPLAPMPCDQSNPSIPNTNPVQYKPYACNQPKNKAALDYYPQVGGGGRFPTKCDDSSANPNNRCNMARCGQTEDSIGNCMVTVLDRYTTSFNWAEQNYAAIWLRPHWYLLSNSFITDVVNSGLTFVTGGGYTDSDAPYGHWALAYRTVFVGETQDPAALNNAATPFTSNASPFNNQKGALECDTGAGTDLYCVQKLGTATESGVTLRNEGVAFPRSSFGINQRLFNIYDGPAYQSSNAYLNVKKVTIADSCAGQSCAGQPFLVAPILGLPKDPVTKKCIMPNAAIGWKQPNGFYYPPAFHSDNLYFQNVDIRHYVTQPLFVGTSYKTDATKAAAGYCNWNSGMFNGFTDVDRQTELNDDDGTLTGYVNTISVNKDPFFSGPVEETECASDETAKTSPYDYVTSVVYPKCLAEAPFNCGQITLPGAIPPDATTPLWNTACSNELCAGVPLYRQYDVDFQAGTATKHFIRMSGQNTGQRSTLSANNGLYYIDTTISAVDQATIVEPPVAPNAAMLSVFEAGKDYYSFMIYAKPTSRQTYQVFVGTSTGKNDPDGFNVDKDVVPVTVQIRTSPPKFEDMPEANWPKTWRRTYDPATGILEVTMDMNNNDPFKTAYNKGLLDGCQPQSFCVLSGGTTGTCGCATDPITGKAVAGCLPEVCSKWAGKDTACPEGGCWGFRFRLANSFAKRPLPAGVPPSMECFPTDAAAGWQQNWTYPPESLNYTGNSCYRKKPQPPIPPPVVCRAKAS